MNRILIVFCALLWVTASGADSIFLPEPPAFKLNTDPEVVLQDYPLGTIPRQAAFAHHGGPDKKISLANSKEKDGFTLSVMLPSARTIACPRVSLR